MPFIPWILATFFSFFNGYYQGRYFGYFASYEDSYIFSPTYVIGVIVFVVGMIINMHSDYTLIYLRQPGQTGYFIPTAGCFQFVSGMAKQTPFFNFVASLFLFIPVLAGANFMGEIIEWFGYCIAGNFVQPVLAFAIFTACNIGPRAVWHHKWYLEKFKNYPKSRKALIPFLL
jgi:3-oxo-5-alpha-steroid 4-dehydrogenase 1